MRQKTTKREGQRKGDRERKSRTSEGEREK